MTKVETYACDGADCDHMVICQRPADYSQKHAEFREVGLTVSLEGKGEVRQESMMLCRQCLKALQIPTFRPKVEVVLQLEKEVKRLRKANKILTSERDDARTMNDAFMETMAHVMKVLIPAVRGVLGARTETTYGAIGGDTTMVRLAKMDALRSAVSKVEDHELYATLYKVGHG